MPGLARLVLCARFGSFSKAPPSFGHLQTGLFAMVLHFLRDSQAFSCMEPILFCFPHYLSVTPPLRGLPQISCRRFGSPGIAAVKLLALSF